MKLADLDKLPRIAQSSRLKCVQCWSGRVNWEGFRAQELLRLVGAKTDLLWVRVDCADKYYDFVKLEDLLHPRTLFAVGMNGEALSPEHGAPLRLVMPAKYGYKSSKLITKLTFVDKGGMGLVADGWPYYSASGDILAGVDHPFEFPDETRKIAGGEITSTDKGEGRRENALIPDGRESSRHAPLLAACMADWWLPRRVHGAAAPDAGTAGAAGDRRDLRGRRPLRGHARP